MRKSRYVERAHLCSYNLKDEFFKKMGIEVYEIQPLRKVYILKTNLGDKILKKVYFDEKKIEFINESIKYISKSFKNIMHLNKIDGENVFVKDEEGYYIVMDKIVGREAINTNFIELDMCAEALAKLHLAGVNIKPYLKEKGSFIIDGENLVEKYKEIELDLIEIKKWVDGYEKKNEFDEIFLKLYDDYINEVRCTKEMLWASNYSEMIKDENLYTLCHNDLAHHNFLIREDVVSFIDFDYADINLKAVDIADFLLKWTKNSSFDIEKGMRILEKYNTYFKISKDEFKLIYILLSFPRDIYSIIRSYYHKEKNWDYDVFLSRFKNKICNDENRREFLVNYKTILDSKM